MNLPEYRAAVRDAHSNFQLALSDAAETLGRDLARADEMFFEDQPKIIARHDLDEVAAMKRAEVRR